MDPELDIPDSDATNSFDPRPPGSFPLNSDQDSRWHRHVDHDSRWHTHAEQDSRRHTHADQDSRWHTHADHDAHLHPSRNRPHVSSHSHHRGGGHHHGHHHHHDNHSSGGNTHRHPRYYPRNPNYRLSRDELRSVAAQTLDVIDNGWYIPDGTDVPIDLGPKLEYTNAQTAYYPPDDEEMAAWATKNLGQEKKETRILIKEYSTLVGARKLHGMLALRTQVTGEDGAESEPEVLQEDEGKKGKEGIEENKGKAKEGIEEIIASGEEAKETKQPHDQLSSTETVKQDEAKQVDAGEEVKEAEQTNEPQPTSANHTIGVLNFASAKKPGGGFINGSQAQEESIARSSTLYPSLVSPEGRKFYTHFRADPDNAFYTHAMVYSPAVVLFRGDMGDWKKPIDVDVLTSAAVNAGDVRENLRRDQEMHSLRVRVREAELMRRAEAERMWEENERKVKEYEERKAAENEKKATEVKESKAAEEIKVEGKSKVVEEKKETGEAGAKDKDDQEKTSDEVAEEKATEAIKSDAEKVEVESVEHTSTQQSTEEEETSKIDVSEDDLTSPSPDLTSPSTTPQPPADPLTSSNPLEPDSSSPPPAGPWRSSKLRKPKPSAPPGPTRRPRPAFPPLRDLPPAPTQTLEEADDIIANTMYERIARLLFLFHQRGAMHLVLGSFGTGVFQNHIRLVAEIFYILLAAPGAPFKGKFETVVFAILGGATVREFRDVFGEKAAPDGPDELDGEDSEIEGMKDEVAGGAVDPRGEDGKADELAQSAGVQQQDGAVEENGTVVDQDVQTDVLMADDEATKGSNEPEDVEMRDLTKPPADADSKSDPAPPTTTTTDSQTQTETHRMHSTVDLKLLPNLVQY
jgi:hypothetical protein